MREDFDGKLEYIIRKDGRRIGDPPITALPEIYFFGRYAAARDVAPIGAADDALDLIDEGGQGGRGRGRGRGCGRGFAGRGEFDVGTAVDAANATVGFGDVAPALVKESERRGRGRGGRGELVIGTTVGAANAPVDAGDDAPELVDDHRMGGRGGRSRVRGQGRGRERGRGCRERVWWERLGRMIMKIVLVKKIH